MDRPGVGLPGDRGAVIPAKAGIQELPWADRSGFPLPSLRLHVGM